MTQFDKVALSSSLADKCPDPEPEAYKCQKDVSFD